MHERRNFCSWRSETLAASRLHSYTGHPHRRRLCSRPFVNRLILVLCLLSSGLSVRPLLAAVVAQSSAEVKEEPVTLLPIAGAVSRTRAQMSGLAWYGDHLILLPQYPARYENNLFYLTKEQIVAALKGVNAKPLRAGAVPLFGAEALAELEGFEGFESIAFVGERVYLTVETDRADGMLGFVTTGLMMPDLSGLRLYPTFRSEIAPQTNFRNLSDEAMFVAGDQVVTLYELNGALFNREPVAHLFAGDDLQPLGTMPLAPLDFRITDATPLDAENRFWVINTFYADDIFKLGPDALAEKYGMGPTHRQHAAVERLVQMQYSPTGITLVQRPPIQLELTEAKGRNWEGIARLETPEFSGFLLVTDKKPKTLLGFVADPQE